MIEYWYLPALGLLVGYLIGFQRGLYRLPLLPTWRRPPKKPSAPTPPADPVQAALATPEGRAAVRNQITADVLKMYPELGPTQRNAVVEEIIEKGAKLSRRMAPRGPAPLAPDPGES